MSERFSTATAGAVATVTLCQPDDGNRLDPPDMVALGEAIQALGGREEIKAVVIRAEGEDFCLGRRPPPKPASPPNAMAIRENVTAPILSVYSAIRATPVPVIAVVQGRATGFGCALAGHADITIADAGARFSLPEMDNDLPPTLAISAVMNRAPPKAVSWLVYTRREIDAARAYALGLVSELAPAGGLDAALADMLACLTDRNRAALGAIKDYMLTAPRLDDHAAARLGANMLATVFSSRERKD